MHINRLSQIPTAGSFFYIQIIAYIGFVPPDYFYGIPVVQHLKGKTDMENPNIIIRIPEPCHEDWNKMIPDEKGKFCYSCNKSVFDFSNKTDAQIKKILMEHRDQKVCGHFKKSQINRPLNIKLDLNDLPKNMCVTKMFVIALFISFGTLLFSCTDNMGKTVGEIAIVDEIKTENEKENVTPVLGQMAAFPVDTLITIEPYLEKIETVDGEIKPSSYSHVAGGISVEHVYLENVFEPKDSMPVDSILTCEKDKNIVGMMVMNTPTIKEELNKTESLLQNDNVDKIEKTTDLNSLNNQDLHFIIFPNPTSGNFTLKYDLRKRSDVHAYITDINGITKKTIVKIQDQHTAIYMIEVDVSDLLNGVYFVNLTIEGKCRTHKLILEK